MAQFFFTSGPSFSDSLDIHDISNFFVEKQGYVVGAVDKDNFRPLTLKVFIQGETTDALNQKEAALSWWLEQAKLAYGPEGIGKPVLFWSKLGDNETWTYWTVVSGEILFKDVAASDEYQMEADMTLKCLPYATSDPIYLDESPAIDSTSPLYIPMTRGDSSALAKLIIRNTGTVPIHKLVVARRGHKNLLLGDFKPYYALDGTIALNTSWQTAASLQSPQHPFDIGLFDVVARIEDTSKPLLSIEDLTALMQPNGNLTGGFYEYIVTAIDALGEESGRSNTANASITKGSQLVNDPNPDPRSLQWGGPEFLGGSCYAPFQYAIDGPGICQSTPSGLFISCASDGWILNNVPQLLLKIPNVPRDAIGQSMVGPTNKLPPKPGEIGHAYTGLTRAFSTPVTGQLVFQYQMDLQAMTPGGLGSPIFFPQVAPFGLMRSPFGWAFYCSSASSSFDIEALVNDWKSGKLKYALFQVDPFHAGVNTITISMDWRNGPLTASLQVDGTQVAALEAEKAGAPANDLFLGVVVTNVQPEYTFHRIMNPDQASWSYTKVQRGSTSDSASASSSGSDSSSTTNSDQLSDSYNDSTNHSQENSDSASNSHSISHNDSKSDSSNSSLNTGKSHSDSKAASHSTTTDQKTGDESTTDSSSDGSSDGTNDGKSKSGNTSDGGGDSSSNENSKSHSISNSDGTGHDESHSSSNSKGKNSSTSTSLSKSFSHSETDPGDITFDIPVESYTRKVKYVGQVFQTTKSTSSSSSQSTSTSKGTNSSRSASDGNSNSDSKTFSNSDSDSYSHSDSSNNSNSADSSTSDSTSTSKGSTSSANSDSGGASSTSKTTSDSTSDSKSSSDGKSKSSSDSKSDSYSSQNSVSHGNSHSNSITHSQSNSHSNDDSSSSSTSGDTSTSSSVSTSDVYLIQPMVETIIPDSGGGLSSVRVLLSNVIVADGSIGAGASILLTWSPSQNAQNQRVYRRQNIGTGNAANAWQYKVLGGTDTSFLDDGSVGWTTQDPPSLFTGPSGASLRLRYGASPSDMLKETTPVTAPLSNGQACYVRLASLVLPNTPRPEPEDDAPGPFYLEVQGQTDDETIHQNPHLKVTGLWLLAQMEPRFIGQYTGLNLDLLTWKLDHNKERRSSALLYTSDGTTQLATAKAQGELLLSPGGNYLVILAEGPNGVADPNIRFTVECIYTPRTAFAFGFG